MGKWFGQAAEIEALRAENHQLRGQVESLEVRLRAAYGEAGITSLSQEAPAPRPLATARSSASERPPGQPHAHDRGLTTRRMGARDTDFDTPHPARGRYPTTTTSHPTTTSPGPTNDDLCVSRQDNEARRCLPPMGAVSWSCLRACSQV